MNILISEKVLKALNNNQAVVALESTIISHGMPYPQNVQVALQVEKIIEEEGAVPATIGIINGVAIIGLNKEEIEAFGQRKDILKVSRRDLPYVLSQKKWGATTVAATMILAQKAGIEVFVTGGIGGVHRLGNETFDISADLKELSQTNTTVVCAGVKAILDLKLTLEYLETMGVSVLGYKSNNLAAFYSTDSGLPLDYRMETVQEIANFIKTKRVFKIDGGILISNPIPKKDEIPNEEINKYIEIALKLAQEKNIKGKDITPFLLANIAVLTKQKSLNANIKLIYNNAKLGAQIAKELSKLS
ncbi:MAG: pseudouridine-5'-phosphate glycosidase [Bacillales bacterium]|jgi:pseudouridine-5'-phosphate glycosidase|nr:pseudouridine-5'-phosphate glycosidase [Bacillales bacterium]